MKQLSLLLLLLPLAALSQRIQSDQTDAFGKGRRIATSRVEFNGFTTSLAGVLTIKECDTLVCLNLFFKAGKPTATDERTKAILKLENGELLEVYNEGNHKELSAAETGFMHFTLKAKDKWRLLSHKVTGYCIKTTLASVEVSLNEKQQNSFYKTIYLLQAQANSVATLD